MLESKIKIVLLFTFFFISISLNGQNIKMMSYNIRYDNKWDKENNWDLRKEKIVKLINHYNPSIFGIQEGLINQVDYLDSCLQNYYYIGIGREDGFKKGEFAAIFYDTLEFEVLNNSTFWLSESPDSISTGWDAAMERICTYGLFENKNTNKRVFVFNVHYDHIGEIAREKSSELILKYANEINKKNYPVVLMGDFNSVPEDKPIKLLKNVFDDGLEISKRPLYGPNGTFNGFKNQEMLNRIDYIFTKNLNVLNYTHIDDRLNNNRHISDHLPILITIK